jgi:hypothetical protein
MISSETLHLWRAAPPRHPSGFKLAPDQHHSPPPDRSVLGVFWGIFPENPVFTSVGETRDFAKRKTGQFGAVWIEDLRSACGAGSDEG